MLPLGPGIEINHALFLLLVLTTGIPISFFYQVQLLVSTSDVENYKQIKTDLDELRLLVEKSELWVYKSKKDSVSASPGKEKKKKDKKKEATDEGIIKETAKQDSDKNGREDSDSDEVKMAIK